MTEILLFHHAQGQTRGFHAFADELRAAGHVVHAPDLYDGNTFTDLDEGVGYAKEVGFGDDLERGRLAADGLPNELVYAGFSLGVMPAQLLAQTRPGAKGALLFSAALPASEFGDSWPPGVPLQIHMMEDDEWAAEDLPAARELSRRPTARSCSSTRVTATCSLTTACRTTTTARRDASSHSWRTSVEARVRTPIRRWRLQAVRSIRGAASGRVPRNDPVPIAPVSWRSASDQLVERGRVRGPDRSRSPASPCRDSPPTG